MSVVTGVPLGAIATQASRPHAAAAIAIEIELARAVGLAATAHGVDAERAFAVVQAPAGGAHCSVRAALDAFDTSDAGHAITRGVTGAAYQAVSTATGPLFAEVELVGRTLEGTETILGQEAGASELPIPAISDPSSVAQNAAPRGAVLVEVAGVPDVGPIAARRASLPVDDAGMRGAICCARARLFDGLRAAEALRFAGRLDAALARLAILVQAAEVAERTAVEPLEALVLQGAQRVAIDRGDATLRAGRRVGAGAADRCTRAGLPVKSGLDAEAGAAVTGISDRERNAVLSRRSRAGGRASSRAGRGRAATRRCAAGGRRGDFASATGGRCGRARGRRRAGACRACAAVLIAASADGRGFRART